MLYQAMKSAVRLLNKKQTDLVSVVGRSELPRILTHFCKLIAPYQLDYSSQIVIPYYLYHFNKYCNVIHPVEKDNYFSYVLKLELRSPVKTS